MALKVSTFILMPYLCGYMNPHRSIIFKFACGERSGLVVECLIPDRGAVGLSLTIYLSIYLLLLARSHAIITQGSVNLEF